MADLKRTFLDTYSKLEVATFARNRRLAADAAGPLRLLLIDPSPLATRTAGMFRQKLSLVRPHLSDTDARGATVRIDPFLATRLAAPSGDAFSVLEIVKYFAHVGGVVHAGVAKTPADDALRDLEASSTTELAAWPVTALRAIGRATLRSLRYLVPKVLDVATFEGSPGLSLYWVISIGSMGGDRENLLFDLGTDRHRNRVTVFVDQEDRLSVRLFTGDGSRIVLQAPPDAAFEYDKQTVIAVRLAFVQGEILIAVATDKWAGFSRQSLEGAAALDGAAALTQNLRQLVVGSDMEGVSRSLFRIWRVVGYDHMHNAADHQQTLDHLAATRGNMKSCLTYDVDKFMYSPGHKLFGGTSPGSPADLIQPEEKRRPRKETLPPNGPDVGK